MIHLMDRYIDGVLDGTIPSNDIMKKAVHRHLDDIKNGHKRQLRFNPELAERALKFIKMLRHTGGELADQFFDLQPSQAFIVGSIFGWQKIVEVKGKKTWVRRFKKAYIEVARKNGKSELAGAIGLYMLIADGEKGAQIYSAATKREQAMYVMNAALQMARTLRQDSKYIRKLITVGAATIYSLSTNSKFGTLTAVAKKEDGANPYLAIIDEYHAHPNSDLLEVCSTGMGSRLNALLLIITTAGPNFGGACYQLRSVVVEIIYGRKQDDSIFGAIFSVDDVDKWDDQDEWYKANPNMGRAPYLHWMREEFQMALNEGTSKQIQFKNKNLNIWTSVGQTWISDKFWKAGISDISLTDFQDKKAFAGLDLASNKDVAVLSIMIPEEQSHSYTKASNALTIEVDFTLDSGHTVEFSNLSLLVRGIDYDTQDNLITFKGAYRSMAATVIIKKSTHYYWRYMYIPEETIKERSDADAVNYVQWQAEGHIIATPGNITDYNYIKRDIHKISQIVDLRRCDFDPWNASQIAGELQEELFTSADQDAEGMQQHAQSIGQMSEATKKYETLYRSGTIQHDGNPVHQWMLGNVVLKIDHNENIKPDKGKSKEKIDGVISDILALSGYMKWKASEVESVYESRGIRTI